jgi:2-methylcitrate dehydratase PrpD
MTTPSPLTQLLGEFVSSLRYESIPPAAMDTVRAGFADTIGVMIAGSGDEPVRLLIDALDPQPGPASVLFGSRTATPRDAAWINATAAHVLDYDDAGLRGHPSAVMVPAILAEAQACGASGKDMATAYVAGYEVWAELAHREPHAHHRKGWHPTGIFGSIAAAAAIASLKRLNAAQTVHAFAIGASQSAGLMSNFGSMTKPFHAGHASHAGVVAAHLAAAGFTGALDALEHPQGFMNAVSPEGKVDRAGMLRAGQDWHILRNGLGIKKFPMCYCTHRPIDAMLDLLQRQPLRPDEIRSIDVSISGRNATVLRNHRPDTGLAAKFSIEFAMAACVIAGRVTLEELTDAFVQREDIQSMFPKVTVNINPDEDPNSGYAPFDHVVVTLENGTRLVSENVHFAKGAFEVPLSRDELFAKFAACVRVGGASADAQAMFDALYHIEQQPGTHTIPGLGSSRS